MLELQQDVLPIRDGLFTQPQKTPLRDRDVMLLEATGMEIEGSYAPETQPDSWRPQNSWCPPLDRRKTNIGSNLHPKERPWESSVLYQGNQKKKKRQIHKWRGWGWIKGSSLAETDKSVSIIDNSPELSACLLSSFVCFSHTHRSFYLWPDHRNGDL